MNTYYVFTSKDHGQNVLGTFRFGLTVNTFKFMLNHEFEPYILGMYDWVKFYVKNSWVDPYLLLKNQ